MLQRRRAPEELRVFFMVESAQSLLHREFIKKSEKVKISSSLKKDLEKNP